MTTRPCSSLPRCAGQTRQAPLCCVPMCPSPCAPPHWAAACGRAGSLGWGCAGTARSPSQNDALTARPAPWPPPARDGMCVCSRAMLSCRPLRAHRHAGLSCPLLPCTHTCTYWCAHDQQPLLLPLLLLTVMAMLPHTHSLFPPRAPTLANSCSSCERSGTLASHAGSCGGARFMNATVSACTSPPI